MKKLSIWVLFSALATPAIATSQHLPFVEDDYTKARAEASQPELPFFVEVWAQR